MAKLVHLVVALAFVASGSMLQVSAADATCPPGPNHYYHWGDDFTNWWLFNNWQYQEHPTTYVSPYDGTSRTLPLAGVYVARFAHSTSGGSAGVSGPVLRGIPENGVSNPVVECRFPFEQFPNADMSRAAWYSFGPVTCPFSAGAFPAEEGILYCDPNACGNNIKEPWEGCDDGNTSDGDGCDSQCNLEDICAGSNGTILKADPGCPGGADAKCDRVTVTVRMSTSNFAEDQGAVSLQLVSKNDGDVLHNVTTFNNTYQYTYINSRDNDQIVARWVGPRNGNESCVLTVGTFGPHNPFSYQVKADSYDQSANSIVKVAGGAAGLVLCSAPPAVVACVSTGASQWLASQTAMGLSQAVMQDEIGDDPPDPQYAELFAPVIPAPLLPGFPLPTDGSVDLNVAQSMNAWAPVASELAAYAMAATRTIQKLAGAHRAGDDYWADLQQAALRQHLRAIADLLLQEAAAMIAAKAAVQSSSLSPFGISSNEIEAARDQIAEDGFPPTVLQWLSALGAPAASLEAILERIASTDLSGAAGTLADIIVRPAALHARLMFGAHVSAPGPLMCSKGRLASASSFEPISRPIEDLFGTATFVIKSPSMTCSIAGVDNADDQLIAPFDETRHLVSLGIKRIPRSATALGIGTTHAITNAMQSGVHLTIKRESHVLLASTASRGEQGTRSHTKASLDDFKCFRVTSSDAPKFIRGDGLLGDVRDQMAEQALVVGKPRYLCVPAAIDGAQLGTRPGALVCYQAKRCANCGSSNPLTPGAAQSVANSIVGNKVLRLTRPSELCVPSVLNAPSVP